MKPQYATSENIAFQYYGAMLGLWWVVFGFDWMYLAFRYYHEIKPTLDELEGRNRRVIPNKKNSFDDEDDLEFSKNAKKQKQIEKQQQEDIFDNKEEQVVEDIDQQEKKQNESVNQH